MGLLRDNETNNLNGTDHGYKSQLLDVESVGYFTSVAEDLNPGLARTNPASGQSGTWNRGPVLQVHRSNRPATLPSL